MENCRTDPLYRAARQIYRSLEIRRERSGGSRAVLHARAHYVANAHDSFARSWHRVRLAQSHGLHLAARRVEQNLFDNALRLLGCTQELLEWRNIDPVTNGNPVVTDFALAAQGGATAVAGRV